MSSSSETIIPSKESSKMSDNQAILMNLPPEIILDILSRLPIRAIVSCKCVCRQLLELITSAAFAELHLPRSTPGLIIQQSSQYLWKIFKFEDEVEVQHHDIHYKQLMNFDPRDIITTHDGTIWMRGSVNGVLCLVESVYFNEFYICNPITREYIALPEPEEVLGRFMVAACGFGVSSSSGEYKLVRISQGPVTSPGKSSRNFQDLKCVIYTLGTGSWRSIPVGITFQLNSLLPHVFLSGSLHWLVGDAEGYSFIVFFNLETELFNSFPRIPFSIPFEGYGSLVILEDCLCVCDCSGDKEIVIWAMKDYGVGESWTKEYVIRRGIVDFDWMIYEGVWPLKVFKDGDIVFVWQEQGLFYFSSKTETAEDVDLIEWTGEDHIVAMLYTPSLVSLKRFVKENVASFGF